MLATVARRVPDMAFAALLSSAAAKVTWLFSTFTTTWRSIGCESVPSGPLTVRLPLSKVTWTLSGTATGYLAMRDMCSAPYTTTQSTSPPTPVSRATVGHHAPGGGDDRNAQPVHHARDVVAALVDAKTRARDALDLLDHRLAGVVLEADLDHRLAVVLAHGEVLDVALVLQHLGDGLLHFRCRHDHAHLLRRLRVADAGQHVGDGITHAHVLAPTSSP